MSKSLLSSETVTALNENPNVVRATPKRIIFSDAFKRRALDDYEDGMSRVEIFKEAGFDVKALGSERIGHAFDNWLAKVKAGKAVEAVSIGRPKDRKSITDSEKIAMLEAKVEMLKQENDLLRQIRRLERRHQPQQSTSTRNSASSTTHGKNTPGSSA